MHCWFCKIYRKRKVAMTICSFIFMLTVLLTFFSLQTGGGDLQHRKNVQPHIPEDAHEALPKGSAHRPKPLPPAQIQTFRDGVEDDPNTHPDQPQLARQHEPQPQLPQQPPKPQPRQRPQLEASDPSQQQQLLLDRIKELELRIAQLEESRPQAPLTDANAKRSPSSEMVSLGDRSFPRVRYLRNSQRKRILVTGGAGFVGSHLVDRLLLQGARGLVGPNEFAEFADDKPARGPIAHEFERLPPLHRSYRNEAGLKALLNFASVQSVII
jgi:hypothetical protein